MSRSFESGIQNCCKVFIQVITRLDRPHIHWISSTNHDKIIGPLKSYAATFDLWPWPFKWTGKNGRNHLWNLRMETNILVYHNHDCQKWSVKNIGISKSYYFFHNVNQPKFTLCFSIYRCCYGNSFGPTATSDYNIKAYKDAKHDQVLESYLPIAVLGMFMFWS